MKYKIWINGQTSFSDELPPDMLVVGESGFYPVTNRMHCLAAGYPDDLPEEEKNKPAHFNPPFAERLYEKNHHLQRETW